MKSDWPRRQLGQIAELKGRIGWKGLTAKEYTPDGPLFLSVHSLNRGDYVDFTSAHHISQWRYAESPEITLQEDDVLICKDGAGIGKTGIVGKLPGRATINSSLLLVRTGLSALPKYLYYCLSSPYFQAVVKSRLNGATTPHLYQRDITEFPVVLPPLEEQRRIVAFLDESLDAVGEARSRAQAVSAKARLLFDSVLRSQFSQPGSDWYRLPLREVARDFGRGKSKHRPRNDSSLYGGAYPFVQTGDVRNSGTVIREYVQTYNEDGLAQSKLWPAGTLCITIAANIAETAILGFDACFPDSVIGVVPDERVTTAPYLYVCAASVQG